MYFLRREPDGLSVTILACRTRIVQPDGPSLTIFACPMKLIRCPVLRLKKFSLQKYLWLTFCGGQYTVCPRIAFTRGIFFLFLTLRKNFRGITFFASFETPFYVIKKSFSTQRKT
jgi:hypothetical protein